MHPLQAGDIRRGGYEFPILTLAVSGPFMAVSGDSVRRAGPKAAITVDPLDLEHLPESGGARVDAFLREYVVTPKGTGAGDAFDLRDWQRDIVDGLFDEPRPRQGLVSLPRGNGKSTLAAALGLYGLFADGVASPQVVVVASDERQAGIVRLIAKRMVEMSPDLNERAHIFKDRIETPHTDGVFMSLPADPDALHGWDPSLLIVDELHVVTEEVWEAVTSAAGKRESSLTLAISTPAATRDSVMWRLVEQARAGRMRPHQPGNVGDDHGFYFVEYAAPVGCDHTDPAMWETANPALGDFLHADGLGSVLSSMRESSFRRLRLGQWVEDEGAWIGHDDWTACTVPRTVEDGTPIVLGFDGSVGDDATALVAATVEETPHVWIVGLWEKPVDAPHDWTVPRDEVHEAVDECFRRFDVYELAADPAYWRTEIEEWADKYKKTSKTSKAVFVQ